MIPLSVPNLCGNEWKYIKECLDTNWISSVGTFVNLFEKRVAAFSGARAAIATSNGTAALHISLLLAGVQRGDLVILPNITFVAPANTIRYVGADPILIDVDEHSWQMDLDLLNSFLFDETINRNNCCVHKKSGRVIKAILPVHVLGNMCDMDRLLQLADAYHLLVIEDATEALGSFYRSKHAGTFGKLGCLSFNGNKIISTGGGGMILTDDEYLGKEAKHLTTQAKASADEYFHDEVGYNYRLVNLLAAVGVAQMEQLPSFLQKKRAIKARYDDCLLGLNDARSQIITENVTSNNWLYTIKLKGKEALRNYLQENNIEARPFWVPMNQLPAFKDETYYHRDNVSQKIYANCLSLPCSTNLTDEDQSKVIKTILQFYND